MRGKASTKAEALPSKLKGCVASVAHEYIFQTGTKQRQFENEVPIGLNFYRSGQGGL
jgi:hypothetical protein